MTCPRFFLLYAVHINNEKEAHINTQYCIYALSTTTTTMANTDWDAAVNSTYTTLRSSFKSGKTRDLEWRRQQLQQFKKMIFEQKKFFQTCLQCDLHKSHEEGYLMEINPVMHEIQHCLDHLDEWTSPTSKSVNILNLPGSCALYKDPLGVVLVAGAWNYPINLCLSPMAGAIAAGNCIMLKVPSSKYSQKSASGMAEMVHKYLDNDCIRVIEGDRHAMTAVLKPRYDKICFTGGTFVGKIVARAAAEHLTPIALELGGKSPVIVDKGVDINVAAKRICWASFLNSGQTCIRPDYCMVDASIAEAFIKACKAALRDMFGKDASKSGYFGRLVNDRAWLRVKGLVDDSKEYVTYGGNYARDDKYVEPTLMDFKGDYDAFANSSIMGQEIFGPVLPIFRYSNLDDVITHVNAGEKPLVAHVFTSNSRVRNRVLTETSSGGACVNDAILHLSNAALPFGGVGGSGMGRYHGKYTFDMFTHEKSVLIKYFLGDLPQRYPPYSGSFQMTLLNVLQYPYEALHIRIFQFVAAVLAIIFASRFGWLEIYVRPLIKQLLEYLLVYANGPW